MEFYKSGKKGRVWKPKPKLSLNPKWKGKLISKDELERLYLKEHLGIRAISKMLGVNYKSIKARLKYYGIPMRKYEEAKNYRTYLNGFPTRRKTTSEEIIKLIHGGLTKDEIANELNIHQKTIYQTLRRENYYEEVKDLIKLNACKRNVKPEGYFSKQLKHKVRSRWEEIVGLILKENGLPYQYEPFILPLEKSSHLPDFKICNIFLEVKGFPTNNEHRITEAIERYPEYEFWLIYEKHQEKKLRSLMSLSHQSYALFNYHENVNEKAKKELINNLRGKLWELKTS